MEHTPEKLWKDGMPIEAISKELVPNDPPTNLWKFGIPKEETEMHNNRYYVSTPYLAELLDVNPWTIRYNADIICVSHHLNPHEEIIKLNDKSYRNTDFISEELIYLLVMSLDKTSTTIKLRKTFAQILWSSDHSMTLPFPSNDLKNIQNKLNELKASLDFLYTEIEKSIQYSQRTIVE